MTTLVKICGIKSLEAANAAIENGADVLGFVFAESKRKVSKEEAKEIISKIPKSIIKVGVFVDSSEGELREIFKYCGLDYVQLHGDETPEFCNNLKLPYIKAFGTKEDLDSKIIEQYNSCGYLFDAPAGKYVGGNGIAFDWSILNTLSINIREKLILAGGLNCDNVKKAINEIQPIMVDVSSGVETDGEKDINKIKNFIIEAKGV